MRLLMVTSVACLTFVFGCGRQQPQSSKVKVDISVPGNQFNSERMAQLTDSLEQIRSSGRGVVSLVSLIGLIPFTAAELAQINESRGDEASITCEGSICTGTNSGTALDVHVSQMNLPGLGVPHIAIDHDIQLKFRLGNAQRFDVCSVNGFSVKKFLLWSPLVAAYVNLDSNRQAVDGVIVGSPSQVARCN